jgi:hypothetical protein
MREGTGQEGDEGRRTRKQDPPGAEHRGARGGRQKDPRLESLISDWKKGEKDRWRGHGKSDGKRKR